MYFLLLLLHYKSFDYLFQKIYLEYFLSCGHFYAVEYLDPFEHMPAYTNAQRWNVAIHLTGTLKLLYDGFINEDLHW